MEHQRNAVKQKIILTIIVIVIAHAADSTAGATRYTALQQSDFTVDESDVRGSAVGSFSPQV